MQSLSDNELLQRYLDRKHGDLEKLERAILMKDFAQVHRIGHNLAGSGAAYGFIRITNLGKQIEVAAQHRSPARLTSLVTELKRFLDTVIIRDSD